MSDEEITIRVVNKHLEREDGITDILFKIMKSTPLKKVFKYYKSRITNGEYGRIDDVEAFHFSFNGKRISEEATAQQIHLEDDGQIDCYLPSIEELAGLYNSAIEEQAAISTPSNKELPIQINFINEDGEVLQLKTKPSELANQVFDRYARQQGTPILLGRIMYKYGYNGKKVPPNVIIGSIGIDNNAIVYVKAILPKRIDFNNKIVFNMPGYVKYNPRCFINEKVPINDITGTITDYDEDNGLFIIDCYTIGKTKQYDMDHFITLLQDYYSNLNGFYQDIRLYLFFLVLKYEDQVEQLDADQALDKPNAIMLRLIKIKQQIHRLLGIINGAVTSKEEWGEEGITMFNYFSDRLKEVLSSLADKKKSHLSNKSIHKVKKPLLEPEEAVWVKRWPNNDKTLEPSWEKGTIRSYTEHEDIDGYGPRRVYSVEFDNGDLQTDIEDCHVVPEANFTQEYDLESVGIKRLLDKDSSDQWASEVGWHTVEIDGLEEAFVYMSDALEAINLKNEAAGFIEQQIPKTTIYQEFEVEFCILQSIGRLSDPIMRRIGRILLRFVLSGVEHDGLYWKAAQGHRNDHHITQMKDSVYKFALSKQCEIIDFGPDPSITVQQVCRFFICSEGCLDTFLLKVPIFREGYDSTVSEHENEKDLLSGHNTVSPDPEMTMALMMFYLKENEPENSDRFLNIRIITGNETERYTVPCDAQFKEPLTRYADDRHTSIKSLRIKHNERTLFISGIGKKTLEELGIQDYDTIEVTILQTTNETTSNEPLKQPSPKGKNKKRNNKKKHKKSNKRRPVQVAPPEDLKGEHSKLLGKVYEEAEPTFKEIRQRLNALNLERTKPKQRTSPSKATKPVEVVDNLIGDGQLGGKAGKTQFIIQVGEVSNLYKTTKPSSAGRGRRQDDIMIDLHGLTAEEAVYRLDKHLPDWIETAMKGTYPFVIPVKIVCGGGSQILAEVVENWIKQNDHVANAPKNMYS